MDLPIVLTPEGPVPLYLQIKSQISYLITSGQLTEGHRLPPVRTVAESLRVNPGTVAQAYRELQHDGLIDAAVGRGTFVAAGLPVPTDVGVRQIEATAALEKALTRLRSLGLTRSESRLRFEATLASGTARTRALLAAPTEAIASKYAASLTRDLGAGVAFDMATFAELEKGSPQAAKSLEVCYFVVTFTSSVRRVELAVERFDRPFQVLGMTTELQDESIEALGRMAAGTRALIVAEERYAHQSLGLLVKHSRLRAEDVDIVTLEALDAAGSGAEKLLSQGAGPAADDRVLMYTFGARPVAERVRERHVASMELRYDVGPESLRRLRGILLPD